MTTKPLTCINQQLLLRSSFHSSFLLTLLTFYLGSPGELKGQGGGPVPPDCSVFFVLNTGTTTVPATGFDNRFIGCTTWTISYATALNGAFTGFTLTVQSAPSSITSIGAPGTFVTYAGTVVTGVNPNTNTTGAETTFNNGTVSIPWIRVNLSNFTGTGTGTGTVFGVLQGWTTGHSGSSPGGGGTPCPGTSGTPCVVDGPTAAGSPPTTPPVLVAGQDGVNLQTLKTDTGGRLGVVGGAASGATVVGNPVLTAWWDGTNVRTPIYCPNQALIAVTASGSTQVIAHSGTKSTYICHVDFSGGAATNWKLTSGTGGTCGVSTADITGVSQQILAVAFDYGGWSPVVAGAGLDVCVNSSAAITGGGTIFYAQF